MKRQIKTKVKTICEGNPKDFDRELNQTLEEFSDYEPDFKFIERPDMFVAIVTWQYSTEVCETVADEFYQRGIKRKCHECPYFEPSTDGRHVTGYCHELSAPVRKDKSACELYYVRLKEGTL